MVSSKYATERVGILEKSIRLVQDPDDEHNKLIAVNVELYSKNSPNGRKNRAVDVSKKQEGATIYLNTRKKPIYTGNNQEVGIYGTIAMARNKDEDGRKVNSEITPKVTQSKLKTRINNVESLALPTNGFLDSVYKASKKHLSEKDRNSINGHLNNMVAIAELVRESINSVQTSEKKRKVVLHDELSDSEAEDDAQMSHDMLNVTI